MVMLKTVVLGATVWLLHGLARPAAMRARWWLLGTALVALAPAATSARPQLWTLLGLSALGRLLASEASLWWAVPLFAAWANLHGGWTVGAGMSALWLLGRAIDTRRVATSARQATALATGIVATLATPYGVDLWRFVATTIRIGRNITEWRPLWDQPDLSHGVLWLLTTLVVCLALAFRRDRPAMAGVLPVVSLAVMGAFVDRLAPLYAIVSLWLTSSLLRPAIDEPREADRLPGGRPPGAWTVDAALVALVWFAFASNAAACLPVRGDWTPDLEAASAFADERVHGRLVLPFNWGEYALWHWGPRLRVSIDGRRETIYSDRVLRTQADAARGGRDGVAFLADARPEYVWLPRDTGARTADWLRTHGYRMDIVTSRSFIATRADVAPLAPGLAPVAACFP